jgi:hypothetical protein
MITSLILSLSSNPRRAPKKSLMENQLKVNVTETIQTTNEQRQKWEKKKRGDKQIFIVIITAAQGKN